MVGYFIGSADGLQHGFIATLAPQFAGIRGRANCDGKTVAALLQAGRLKLGVGAVLPDQQVGSTPDVEFGNHALVIPYSQNDALL